MKTLFFKLLPGVLACAAVAIGINWSHAQSVAGSIATLPTNQPGAFDHVMAAAPATSYPAAAAPAPQYIICGHCGARIEAPVQVWIAAPVGGELRRGAPAQFSGQSFYGIPPVGYVQPYAQPVCYVDPYRRGADEQRFDLPPPRQYRR